MQLLDEAPGVLILVVLVIIAFLCWATLQGMYESINTDKIAMAIVCMVIAVIFLIIVVAGAAYLLGRLFD